MIYASYLPSLELRACAAAWLEVVHYEASVINEVALQQRLVSSTDSFLKDHIIHRSEADGA